MISLLLVVGHCGESDCDAVIGVLISEKPKRYARCHPRSPSDEESQPSNVAIPRLRLGMTNPAQVLRRSGSVYSRHEQIANALRRLNGKRAGLFGKCHIGATTTMFLAECTSTLSRPHCDPKFANDERRWQLPQIRSHSSLERRALGARSRSICSQKRNSMMRVRLLTLATVFATAVVACTSISTKPEKGGPMNVDQIKQALVGDWTSIAPEVRPSAAKNRAGTLKPF